MVMLKFLGVINLQISISPLFRPNYCPIYEMFYAIRTLFMALRPFLFCPHVGTGVAIKFRAVNNARILINLEKNREQLTMSNERTMMQVS